MGRILPLWYTDINSLNNKVNKLDLKDVLRTSYKIGRKYIFKKYIYIVHSQNYTCEVMVLENLKTLFTVLCGCGYAWAFPLI